MTERYQVPDVLSEPVQVHPVVGTLPVQGPVPTLLAFVCAAGMHTSDAVQPPSGLLCDTAKPCDLAEEVLFCHEESEGGQSEPVEAEVEVANIGIAGASNEMDGNCCMQGEKAVCIGRTGGKEGLCPCCVSKHKAKCATSCVARVTCLRMSHCDD